MPPLDSKEFSELLTQGADLAHLVESVLFDGTPFVFESDPNTWQSVRASLAAALGSCAQGIYVVGSAKMGYSLAPHKYGRPFADGSDIDVIVIDADLYDRIWLSILRWHYRRRHRLPSSDRHWDEERRDGLYWGYLNPVGFRYRGLSRSRQLKSARDVSTTWFNAFQALGLLPELAGIESILLGLPIPEVYIQQTVDEDGETTHAIVDGQQRIRTILQYIGVEADEESENDFALDRLSASSTWLGASFADLNSDDRRRFWGYRLAVRELETDNEGEVRDMFKRLNKYTVPLKPQELRNATYIGPFARFVTAIADESEYWAENSIVSTQSIRRMGDIEFVAEPLIGTMHGPQGGSAAVIDDYYAQYEDYEDEFPEQRSTRRRFNATLVLIQKLFPEIRRIRWRNKTDFYSLFVVCAFLIREQKLATSGKLRVLRDSLTDFAEGVEARQADEAADVAEEVQRYVRALTRGANDKARRGERHRALLAWLAPILE